VIEPKVLQILKLSNARRNLPRELVVGEVDKLKLGKDGDGGWNLAEEGVGGEVNVFEMEGKFSRDFPGEVVAGDVENLESGEVSDLRRELAGEVVIL